MKAPPRPKWKAILDLPTLAGLVADIINSHCLLGVDTETTGLDMDTLGLVGIALALDHPDHLGVGYYVPVGHKKAVEQQESVGVGLFQSTVRSITFQRDQKQVDFDDALTLLKPILEDPDIPKVMHNATFDYAVFKTVGITVAGLIWDTMTSAWFLHGGADPGIAVRLGLKDQVFHTFKYPMAEITTLIGTGKDKLSFDRVDIEQATPYAAEDGYWTLNLKKAHEEALAPFRIDPRAWESTLSIPYLVYKMRTTGVKLDIPLLQQIRIPMVEKMAEVQEVANQLAGFEINLGSPQQRSDLLYKNLRLPTEGTDTIYGGTYWSTKAEVLEQLNKAHPFIPELVEWTHLQKLISTYVDGLPPLVNPATGCLHPDWRMLGTFTGRAACREPNLQNIPNGGHGRNIRKALIAPEGWKIVAADYSQMELRILAFYCDGAPAGVANTLREAFLRGDDAHTATAVAIFEKPADQITPEERRFAKTVNFGLVYGMSASGLATRLGISKEEAKEFIKKYFKALPAVEWYIGKVRERAQQRFFVSNVVGARRIFEPIQEDGKQPFVSERQLRQAINYPIQSFAAWILNIAMPTVQQGLERFGGTLTAQVHDELVGIAPTEKAELAAREMERGMESAYSLRDIPIRAEASIGDNWYEVKG